MWKLALIAVLAVCFSWTAAMSSDFTGATVVKNSPVRVLKITMAHHERQKFVNQIAEFAAKNAIEIRVAQRSPDPEDIRIHMWRNDVKLLAYPVIDPNILDLRYNIPIYSNGDQPLPMTTTNQLVEDLRIAVEDLDNVTFTILQQVHEKD